jgi:hypothetical protein
VSVPELVEARVRRQHFGQDPGAFLAIFAARAHHRREGAIVRELELGVADEARHAA